MLSDPPASGMRGDEASNTRGGHQQTRALRMHCKRDQRLRFRGETYLRSHIKSQPLLSIGPTALFSFSTERCPKRGMQVPHFPWGGSVSSALALVR